MRRLFVAIGCCVTLACGHEAAPDAPGASDDHRRMVEALAAVEREARVENPYLGRRRLPEMRRDLEALPDTPENLPHRWLLHVLIAKHELRLGNEESAIEHYESAYRLMERSPDPVPRESFVRSMFEMGVAYLRLAETENCVRARTADSCLFPVRGEGVHAEREPSRRAAAAFTQVLEVADPQGADAMRARWLLNVAAMTLGEYPDGVPPQHRIPPENLAPEDPFPRMPDIAVSSGIDGFELAGGAVAEDFDDDGDIDLMTSSMDTATPLRLWVNAGDGTFEPRVAEAGLTGLTGGLNLVSGDYDGDGRVDVLVLRGGWWREHGRHPNSLLRNLGGGRFADVTFAAGLGEVHYPTQTAAFADYDLDGDLDLYVGNESGPSLRFDDAEDEDGVAPGQLFRNEGNGRFTDVAEAAGVTNLRYAKAVAWGDYDGDRYPDLFVSNSGHRNRLYRNRGDGTFEDVALETGVDRPIASFPAWFWDADNDGALDLFVAAYGGRRGPPDVAEVAAGYFGLDGGGTRHAHFIGDGRGGFRDRAGAWGLTRVSLPMGANFGDVDNDGWLDVYLGTGYPYYEALTPNLLYRNADGRAFRDVTFAAGVGHLQKGHAVVFADFDGDGDTEIFEQVGGAFPGDAYANALFDNPGFDRHHLRISLVGRVSNRHGVLSRVTATFLDGGVRRSVHRQVGTGASFGASPHRLELGLASAARVERLAVYWPASDRTQTFEDVPADTWIVVDEGEAEYRIRNDP